MNSNVVVSVDNVSKAFEIYRKPIDLLFELIGKGNHHDVFWALRNVSFKVCEGERIGFIGMNGAGKSTMLKIITGILSPTSGNIKVFGSISSMLSLNASLDENETGISNIKFNLQMKGVSKSQLSYLVEEIVDFTELGHFIYAPVKTYSTGMNARLAFAIATALTPDILVVDEVLSVGDGYFVGKATQRMLDLCKKGRALLYVSHSLSAVQMLCDRVIWLDKGMIRMQGPTDQIVKCYEEDFRAKEDYETRKANREREKKNYYHANLDQISDSSVWRLRIVPMDGQVFRDVNYIQSIHLMINDQKYPVFFNIENNEANLQKAYLDVFNSEWGSLFEHNENQCITLTTTTGRNKGGHIIIHKSNAFESNVDVVLEMVYSSEAGLDELSAQYLNENTGLWESMDGAIEVLDNKITMPKNIKKRFHSLLNSADKVVLENVKQALRKNVQSSVEIQDVHMLVHEEKAFVVKEGTPFKIIINAEIIRHIPLLDFGIRIMRSDGVFAFWQSTGFNNENIPGNPGLVRVCFYFEPNLFPDGEYSVIAYAANGWDLEKNYPYSEVFDRKISLKFNIQRECELIGFGALNQRVKVDIVCEKISKAHVKEYAS